MKTCSTGRAISTTKSIGQHILYQLPFHQLCKSAPILTVRQLLVEIAQHIHQVFTGFLWQDLPREGPLVFVAGKAEARMHTRTRKHTHARAQTQIHRHTDTHTHTHTHTLWAGERQWGPRSTGTAAEPWEFRPPQHCLTSTEARIIKKKNLKQYLSIPEKSAFSS